MYVCMYVCVCMYVHVYVCFMYVRRYAWMCVSIWVKLRVYVTHIAKLGIINVADES